MSLLSDWTVGCHDYDYGYALSQGSYLFIFHDASAQMLRLAPRNLQGAAITPKRARHGVLIQDERSGVQGAWFLGTSSGGGESGLDDGGAVVDIGPGGAPAAFPPAPPPVEVGCGCTADPVDSYVVWIEKLHHAASMPVTGDPFNSPSSAAARKSGADPSLRW